MPPSPTTRTAPSASVQQHGAGARVALGGDWVLGATGAEAAAVVRAVEALPAGTMLSFDARALGTWDSALIALLLRLDGVARERRLTLQADALPDGARHLLALATAVPERVEARNSGGAADAGPPGRRRALGEPRDRELRRFRGRDRVGAGTLRNRARADAEPGPGTGAAAGRDRRAAGGVPGQLPDGPDSRVRGGAAQLRQFGATIFVANLVAIGVVRDLGRS